MMPDEVVLNNTLEKKNLSTRIDVLTFYSHCRNNEVPG